MRQVLVLLGLAHRICLNVTTVYNLLLV